MRCKDSSQEPRHRLLLAWEHTYQQYDGGVQQDLNEIQRLVHNRYRFEVDEYLL